MKKAFAFMICILFIASLGGCSYLSSTPIASHTGEFVLPAGSSLPSSGTGAPALSVPTSAGDSFAFKKANWGMSRDQVIASEGRQPDESAGNRIAYNNQTVLNKQCTLFYIFSQGQLVSAGYDFAVKPSGLGDCIPYYTEIVSGITAQYVPPVSSQTLWSNGEFKNDPQKYGLAVLLGDLVYTTGWTLSGSAVNCELHASATGGVRGVSVTATWQAPTQTASPAQTATASASQSASASAVQSATASATQSASASAALSASPSESPLESPSASDIPIPSPTETQPSGFSFRNTSWGMSKDAVIASEGSQPEKTTSDGIVYLEQTFLGQDCSLFYVFNQGMLQNGGYDIAEDAGGIKDYTKIVSSLTKLYGDPTVSELLWSNPARQGDPSAYGRAVSEGALVYRNVWYTDSATVSCLLYGYGKGSQKETAITVSYQNPAASTADIETPAGYSFRQTTWGMSMDQVITSEGRQPDEKGADYMIYKKEKYHNADCHIIYQFANGSLVSGTYMIYNMHTNPNDYIKDYNTAVSILRQSYGTPQASNQIWNNPASRYKNDVNSYGLAVLRGDLSLSSTWVQSQSSITCSITLANTIVAIDVTYKAPTQ